MEIPHVRLGPPPDSSRRRRTLEWVRLIFYRLLIAMKKPLSGTATIIPPTQQDISRRAREIWESHGSPEGRDLEIWLEAESQLLGLAPAPAQNKPLSLSPAGPSRRIGRIKNAPPVNARR